MSTQPEQILEDKLVAQLQQLGYAFVAIRDEQELLANLKAQLETHNSIEFTSKEFDRVLNILSKGSVFDKTNTLREKQHIGLDSGYIYYWDGDKLNPG